MWKRPDYFEDKVSTVRFRNQVYNVARLHACNNISYTHDVRHTFWTQCQGLNQPIITELKIKATMQIHQKMLRNFWMYITDSQIRVHKMCVCITSTHLVCACGETSQRGAQLREEHFKAQANCLEPFVILVPHDLKLF